MSPQGTSEWDINHRWRLTSRNFCAAIGKSNFTTPAQVASDIINPVHLVVDKRFAQLHGIRTEPEARDWYCNTRKVVVEEVGLAVPKWEPRLGTSIDGDVMGTDGMIEIKSPYEMYKPLRDHIAKIENGWTPPKFYHSHIWESHYAQMQGSMKIINKKWCDYIVYATESNLSYVERVFFDQTYWDTVLLPGIQSFFNNHMEPLIALQNS